MLDSRPKSREFEPHRHHCVVSLSKFINPRLVLVQPRKIRPFIADRLLMGCSENLFTDWQTVETLVQPLTLLAHACLSEYLGVDTVLTH